MLEIELTQDEFGTFHESDSCYSGSSDSEDDETFKIALEVPHKLRHANGTVLYFTEKSVEKSICTNNKYIRAANEFEQLHNDLKLGRYKNKSDKELTTIEIILNETLQICMLLPESNFAYVYEQLQKNIHAKNRIEITIWKLMQRRKPTVQSFNDNHCGSTSNNWHQNSEENATKKHDETVKPTFNDFDIKSLTQQTTPTLKPSSFPNVNVTNVTENSTDSLYNANIAFFHNDCINHYMMYLQILQSIKAGNVTETPLPDLTKDKVRHFLLENWNNPNNTVIRFGTKNVGGTHLESSTLPSDTTQTKLRVEHNVSVAEDQSLTNAVIDPAITDLYFMEVWETLVTLFPTINTDYIMQLCQERMQTVNHCDHSYCDDLIDHLLEYQNSMIEVDSDVQSDSELETNWECLSDPQTNSINRLHNILINIFPDADPTYIKEMAKKLHNSPTNINEFIEDNLENPKYPSKEKYLEKKRIAKERRQYTSGFTVRKFLKIFPDPFTYFLDPSRNCEYSPLTYAFLADYFFDVNVADVRAAYKDCRYILSLSFKSLKNDFPFSNRKKIESLPMPDDIKLLQEIAFLAHEDEIKDFISDLKEKENKLFNKMKDKNQLLECNCCYDKQCIPFKVARCDKGHVFCNSCIIRGVEAQLSDGNTHVACFTQCDSEFSLSVLRHVIPPEKFSVLLKKRQEAEINAAGLEGLVHCPFCDFASIPPPEDKVFQCFNPKCMKKSCRKCKALDHLPDKCYDMKVDAARLFLEEKMTEALVRKCPNCRRTYMKEGGCNKMQCLCGVATCYVCDATVDGYVHFAGQGSTDTTRCPLFSDDEHLNNKVVQQVAEEVVRHIKEEDPDIEIDSTHLLPNVPARIFGPHDFIPNADAILTKRVNKVAQFHK